jgi:hypothetical protein
MLRAENMCGKELWNFTCSTCAESNLLCNDGGAAAVRQHMRQHADANATNRIFCCLLCRALLPNSKDLCVHLKSCGNIYRPPMSPNVHMVEEVLINSTGHLSKTIDGTIYRAHFDTDKSKAFISMGTKAEWRSRRCYILSIPHTTNLMAGTIDASTHNWVPTRGTPL